MSIETVLSLVEHPDADLLELKAPCTLALIDCARALEEMTARFYCPGDSVYENAMGALAKLEACE